MWSFEISAMLARFECTRGCSRDLMIDIASEISNREIAGDRLAATRQVCVQGLLTLRVAR
jgi:hypothetical protein